MFRGKSWQATLNAGQTKEFKGEGRSVSVKASAGFATVSLKFDGQDEIMLPGDVAINDVPGGFHSVEVKSLVDANVVSVVVTNAQIG